MTEATNADPTRGRHPVRLEGRLDPHLSRWLWLVKWLLAVPHYLVLVLLWLAFVVLTVVAFVAILVTARYPRALFEFNVGVLRWSWRVHHYTYAALGTDAYPPFTLADVPDYPARLHIDYPERLSRGLVLVKWWLLAFPQYLVVALFTGGGPWTYGSDGDRPGGLHWAAGGLIGLVVFIGAVALLFTGRYPRSLYDFALGMDRWVARVAAYSALLTDRYPPFRLDQGGRDPAAGDHAAEEAAAETSARPEWTVGRVTATVAGALLSLISLGLLAGGGALLWTDMTQRDVDGYVSVRDTVVTSAPVLTAERVRVDRSGDWIRSADVLGDVRVRVTGVGATENVFAGIAPASAAERYLAGVRRAEIEDVNADYVLIRPGGPLPGPPADQPFWTVRASGSHTLTLDLPRVEGDWTLLVESADQRGGVAARVELGATLPALPKVATGALGVGAVLLAAGAALTGVAARRAAGDRTRPG